MTEPAPPHRTRHRDSATGERAAAADVTEIVYGLFGRDVIAPA